MQEEEAAADADHEGDEAGDTDYAEASEPPQEATESAAVATSADEESEDASDDSSDALGKTARDTTATLVVLSGGDEGDEATLAMGGSSKVSARVAVNSIGEESALLSGRAILRGNISVTGKVQTEGSAEVRGKIETDQAPVTDRFAGLVGPDRASMPIKSTKLLMLNGANRAKSKVSLQPGVYQGGIVVDGNQHVTLAAGIYYLEGGGLCLKGRSRVRGKGVVVFLRPSNAKICPGGLSIEGNAVLAIKAPTSGPYARLGIVQDGGKVVLAGSGRAALRGAYYGRHSSVHMKDSSRFRARRAVVGSVTTTDSSRIRMRQYPCKNHSHKHAGGKKHKSAPEKDHGHQK